MDTKTAGESIIMFSSNGQGKVKKRENKKKYHFHEKIKMTVLASFFQLEQVKNEVS